MIKANTSVIWRPSGRRRPTMPRLVWVKAISNGRADVEYLGETHNVPLNELRNVYPSTKEPKSLSNLFKLD